MEIQSDTESHISPTPNIVSTRALLPIPKTMNSNTTAPDVELSGDDKTHDLSHLARGQPNSTTVQQQIPTTEQLVMETTLLPAQERTDQTKNYPIQHEVSNVEQPQTPRSSLLLENNIQKTPTTFTLTTPKPQLLPRRPTGQLSLYEDRQHREGNDQHAEQSGQICPEL